MLKLVKYEFRKSLTALMTLLGLTAGLEAYFLAALFLGEKLTLKTLLGGVLITVGTLVVAL